ncbi:UDP-2,3-diacylglucosamine diphosphatase|uniref:UDP-2,3-diacylglucosamine diphosphatase n=1 Tax=Noviherbaspirillum sp. L7-7A TaxID=2850560 RepID=UPI001C2C6922|nr:UDP-2,3-diacylglucosamine diphosphatase [Noviherbaspirillum sp. L7-7A]MBV0878954.1 UDP-2,3-diacylglucosamine diphosphatase [Noviherbaspirillum sp. L7-7A]
MKTPAPHTPATAARPDMVALFVSDLHLQPSSPSTASLFTGFLAQHALRARQLYLLGDLFEYWAGDDDIDTPFVRSIVDALAAVSASGVALFWIAGNRDFLVGEAFASAAGLTLLPDPCVASIAGRQIVLTHGDAQCTDDVDYQAFRAQVRSPQWQQAFLAQSLEQRKAVIEGLRNGSREAQMGKSMNIMDVNPRAIDELFYQSDAALLIHGHTHRPGKHLHGGNVRLVLPDWDGDSQPPRGGWLGIDASGAIHRFELDGMPTLQVAPTTPG